MKKSKKFISILMAIMLVGVFTVGCSGNGNGEESTEGKEAEIETAEDKKSEDPEEETQKEILDLADWDGTWNSITWYLEEDEVQGAYEELADRENTSKEETKENYKKRVSTDFTAIVIDGDEITYLDGLEDEVGEEIERVKYEYKEEQTVEHGGRELSWYKFEAIEEAEHEVILLIDVHGEETMPHFHFRYGKKGQELIDMEDWYPTLIKPTTTLDQVYEEIAD